MASSSSSFSSSARWMYDVFLSFRGETRKSFTDHLYANLCQAGINTFRDDESIRKGENISVELLKAIEGSKISIIVFSKTYARSRWCLDELVKVMECKQNLGQKVLPIFYDVDPSEVRKQTGEFGDALTQQRKRFGDQKVDEWKAALITAANLSGWDLQTMVNGYEAKFIKKIIEEVLREVNPTCINVAKYPVGIDTHVRDIHHLLQSQTNDNVRMIGMFGMGGVGKTTLAKAIYNDLSFQRFEGHCFIANIRSEASQHNGLVRLQEKLVCETLKRKKIEIDNVDKGISLIKERLQSKKLLIVLDDINHISQLEALAGQRDWFGSGSIVIITTRDVRLLSDLGAHEKYKVNTLSIDESLQLLSWHAFRVPSPLEDYVELSKRIASYTGGLPLALTIIGSHLRGKSVQEWSDDAEKLRKIPHEDIQNFLKISYDALDDDTQNIFLDIASFFIGHDKNDTATILEACGFYAECGIKTLIERCLLTERFGRLEMHDLVQDMGREIVRKESPREPGRRSRLVDPKDVFDVLQGNKGTEVIEGMIVNSNMFKNMILSTKVFIRMVKLRILIFDGVCLKGSFKYLSNELRVFRLYHCGLNHIRSDFCFEKLTELDLRDKNIKEFQPNMKHFVCLKILKLIDCEQLMKTPDFTGAQSLRKLIFRRCLNLVHVHQSIGILERLVVLDFERCKKLKRLPNSICKLKSIELLSLDCCEKLKELPIDLGKLEQLQTLYVRGTAVSHIPSSVGCLRTLKVLNLDTPKGLLPSKSKSKSKSQALDIVSPHFLSRETHDPVGFFPSSVENLCSLENLTMPNGLHEVDVPISLGCLSSLRELNLAGSYLQSLPFSLCHLSNLKSLNLNSSENLRELLELPPSLEKLSADNCVSMEKIADISNLKRLKSLNIQNCKRLAELPGLESLESLIYLDIKNCKALTIPYNYLYEVDLPSVPGSLSSLYLIGRCYLQSSPLSFCDHYSKLRTLYLDDWQNLKALPQLPPTLECLSTRNCVSLERIADISSLKRLERLYIGNCKNLVELPGLESSHESLRRVEMTNCSGLSIPLIEKWFQAHSKGDSVKISFDRFTKYNVGVEHVTTDLRCEIPTLSRHGKSFLINCKQNFDVDEIGVSVRSKSTGAWILKNAKCKKNANLIFQVFVFEVPTVMGEVLEVYVDIHPTLQQRWWCVFEIHRNTDGEVRFFPSTRGFLEFDETTGLMIESVVDSTSAEQNGCTRRC